MSETSTPDLLAAIVAATRRIVETRRGHTSLDALLAQAERRRPRGDLFRAVLERSDRVNVIAECKRRSPSRGVLRQDYDPAAIARTYERCGAAAISVLTEPTFFDGALDHLQSVRAVVDCPVLRKDFIVDEYQLAEAVACGADAVLLIVAALADEELRRLHRQGEELGLAVLVEVHDEHELDRGLDAGARIVGVNNRNLRTLEVNVDASERLAGRVPPTVTAVSESGLKTRDDLERMRRLGYRAFLIGERLMLAPDPAAVLTELLK